MGLIIPFFVAYNIFKVVNEKEENSKIQTTKSKEKNL